MVTEKVTHGWQTSGYDPICNAPSAGLAVLHHQQAHQMLSIEDRADAISVSFAVKRIPHFKSI